ncbi:MAG: AAA family ATPase [Candidatus Brockarchaeota archaeon]|nr:AAA family ATPase [Candidatus Brockarchaeota archaeon]
MAVFSDRSKLSPRYIPRVLPHREGQIDRISRIFDLQDPSRSHLTPVQLVGDVGTGKTCTAVRFAEQLVQRAKERRTNLRHVYVNLKLQGGSRVVLYRYLVEKAAPEAYSGSMSSEELIRSLVNHLLRTKTYLLITVDEIDYFIKHTKEHLVYDLTRLNELSPGETCGVLGVVFIARGKDFHSLLERSEVSTLGRNVVDFPNYDAEQLFDIIEKRSEEAIKPGAISEEVIRYVAEITASPPVKGDVRHALDLLLYSGNLAESQGDERIELEHVRKVHGETYHLITREDLLNLPEDRVHVLIAVIRALKAKKVAYVTMKDVRSSYQVVCEEMNLKPKIELEEILQDLRERGIIEVPALTKIGISGASAEKIEKVLDEIVGG